MLADAGASTRDLNDIINQLRGFDSDKLYNDPRALEQLQAAALDRLKKFEFDLRKKLGSDNNQLGLSGSDEVPAAQRQNVEEYFRKLAQSGTRVVQTVSGDWRLGRWRLGAFADSQSPVLQPPVRRSILALGLVLTALLPSNASLRAETDLDAFMRQVLVRRDDNWKKLQQYILDEREQVELRGPNLQPLWGERRDYILVHPRRVLRAEPGQVQRRRDRRRRTPQVRGGIPAPRCANATGAHNRLPRRRQSSAPAADPATTAGVDGLLRQVREPQFVSSAYFLRFKFEEGKYAVVGRETLDGHPVVRVEYYPSNLYTDRQRRRMARDHDPRDPKDAEIQRMMNKVALVTMWIEPDAHQIVKYTFDNIGFDFLPAQWLVRLGNVRATMTHAPAVSRRLAAARSRVPRRCPGRRRPLRRPLERGVSRLPAAGREVEVQCRPGTVDDSETDGVTSRHGTCLRAPSHEAERLVSMVAAAADVRDAPTRVHASTSVVESARFAAPIDTHRASVLCDSVATVCECEAVIAAVLLAALLVPQAPPPPEVLADVQVRGNVATPDDEVRRLAGLEIGMPSSPT